MTLRRRLVLTLVLTGVPLLGMLLWLRLELLQRAMEDSLRDSIVARMDAGGRERCEQDPAAFGSRRFRRRERPEAPPTPPGVHAPWLDRRSPRARFLPPLLQAYDRSFQPSDPTAPELPASIKSALAAGDEAASERRDGGLLVAVKMPWDEGPCAVVAAFRPDLPTFDTPPALLVGGLLLCAGFLAAVWLASGPVVRRIRALAGDVRRSAAARYAEPVREDGGDEVALLARAFNEAGREVRAHLSEVEEREATLRTFVANTTHDVMLPLTVLQGHLANLRRDAAGEPRLAAAAEEAHYIGSLLQNLSAAAKLEGGRPLERHPFDVAALVERVVARHRPVASAAGVALEHAVPEGALWAEGDVTLVEQAVGNVVHNAIRHNRPEGHVAVVLDEAGPDAFLLRVADDGPGVPDDQRARLGERRFRTEEARQRHPDGLGLGLSIASDVAARHGFTLRFAPNEPRGLLVELGGPRVSAGTL